MSKMDLFIQNNLGEYLQEITEERYNDNLKNDNYDLVKLKMYEIFDDINDFLYPPHPLKEVIRLDDFESCVNDSGSMSWGFSFQFKHKGKFYLYADYGGT